MFDGLKQMLNIGGASIVMILNEHVYSQGDIVSGEITIIGGEQEQAVKSVSLQLKEFWTEQRRRHSRHGSYYQTVTVDKLHEELAIGNSFELLPKMEINFPFQVQLPRNCRIPTESTGWWLIVKMDIPSTRDPRGKTLLNVQPARELLEIVQTCEEQLGFLLDSAGSPWNPKTGRTCFRLLPNHQWKDDIDSMTLELSVCSDGEVRGEIVFNRQEESLWDHFRALFGKDNEHHSVVFTPSDLWHDGVPNKSGIASIIQHHLQELKR